MNGDRLKITETIGIEDLMIKSSNYFSKDEIIPIVRKVVCDRYWTDGNIAVVAALPYTVYLPNYDKSVLDTFTIVANETYDFYKNQFNDDMTTKGINIPKPNTFIYKE